MFTCRFRQPENLSESIRMKSVLPFFAACFALRLLEYFVFRTDQTFWGEAFLHKLAGIALLFAALRRLGWTAGTIGWQDRNAPVRPGQGLAFGLSVYACVYAAEYAVLLARGSRPNGRGM